VSLLSLFGQGESHLLNVYNDPGTAAASVWIRDNIQRLPGLVYMGGDFNCHSSDWDPDHPGESRVARELVQQAFTLGLEVSVLPERAPTHFPHNDWLWPSVIDLMFLPLDRGMDVVHSVHEWDHMGSDHVPLSVTLPIAPVVLAPGKRTLKVDSDEEQGFTGSIAILLCSLGGRPMNTPDDLEALVKDLSDGIELLWQQFSKVSRANPRSQSWWNEECTIALNLYRESQLHEEFDEWDHVTGAVEEQPRDTAVE